MKDSAFYRPARPGEIPKLRNFITPPGRRPPAELCRLENSHHLVRTLTQVVEDAIRSAVGLCAGDLDLAAERLGISRATLEAELKRISSCGRAL